MVSGFDIRPNFDALREAKLHHAPFDYCFVEHFLCEKDLKKIYRGLPDIRQGGSYPIIPWHYFGAARNLLKIMASKKLKKIIGQKFHEDFKKNPSIVTIRGFSRPVDGKIHTDTGAKVITILLYLSLEGSKEGGNLQLLPGPDAKWGEGTEVSSWNGNLLIFRNSSQAWHGYPSFTGKRCVLQVNYLTNYWSRLLMEIRHGVSAIFKNRPRILVQKKN